MLLVLVWVGVATASLINDVASSCLHKFSLSEYNKLKNHVEFWQTWSEMEFIPLVLDSPHINQTLKDLALTKLRLWSDFSLESKGIPSVFKDTVYVLNHHFWDPTNKRIIWDDRLWLGCSYLQLYRSSGIKKYLEVAQRLYDLIVRYNADPFSSLYAGIQWAPNSNYRNCVTNQLFLVLCARLYDITKKPQYLSVSEIQFTLLFEQAGKYINNNSMDIFPDAVGPAGYYSYNQGIVMEGLAYLIKYGQRKDLALSQLSRLINGMIEHFHDRSQDKLIMTESDGQDSVVASIFRGVVFRHLIWANKVIPTHKWDQLIKISPKLKPFLLDNMQTMSRFQDVAPGFNWYQYNNPKPKYYTIFNQFFVLESGQRLFNITQKHVQGIQFVCTPVWFVSVGSNITSVQLHTLKIDADGVYQKDKHIKLQSGSNFLKYLLEQDICDPRNNRNVFQIQWEYASGQKATFAIVHVQGKHSKLGVVTDETGLDVINSHYVTVRAKCPNTQVSYVSSNGQGKLRVKTYGGCQKTGYLQMAIS